jgi:hypothetical protein
MTAETVTSQFGTLHLTATETCMATIGSAKSFTPYFFGANSRSQTRKIIGDLEDQSPTDHSLLRQQTINSLNTMINNTDDKRNNAVNSPPTVSDKNTEAAIISEGEDINVVVSNSQQQSHLQPKIQQLLQAPNANSQNKTGSMDGEGTNTDRRNEDNTYRSHVSLTWNVNELLSRKRLSDSKGSSNSNCIATIADESDPEVDMEYDDNDDNDGDDDDDPPPDLQPIFDTAVLASDIPSENNVSNQKSSSYSNTTASPRVAVALLSTPQDSALSKNGSLTPEENDENNGVEEEEGETDDEDLDEGGMPSLVTDSDHFNNDKNKTVSALPKTNSSEFAAEHSQSSALRIVTKPTHHISKSVSYSLPEKSQLLGIHEGTINKHRERSVSLDNVALTRSHHPMLLSNAAMSWVQQLQPSHSQSQVHQNSKTVANSMVHIKERIQQDSHRKLKNSNNELVGTASNGKETVSSASHAPATLAQEIDPKSVTMIANDRSTDRQNVSTVEQRLQRQLQIQQDQKLRQEQLRTQNQWQTSQRHRITKQRSSTGEIEQINNKCLSGNATRNVESSTSTKYGSRQNQMNRVTKKLKEVDIWNTQQVNDRKTIQTFWSSLSNKERNEILKSKNISQRFERIFNKRQSSYSCEHCKGQSVRIDELLRMFKDAFYEEQNLVIANPGNSFLFQDLDNSPLSKQKMFSVVEGLIKGDYVQFLSMIQRLAERRLRSDEAAVNSSLATQQAGGHLANISNNASLTISGNNYNQTSNGHKNITNATMPAKADTTVNTPPIGATQGSRKGIISRNNTTYDNENKNDDVVVSKSASFDQIATITASGPPQQQEQQQQQQQQRELTESEVTNEEHHYYYGSNDGNENDDDEMNDESDEDDDDDENDDDDVDPEYSINDEQPSKMRILFRKFAAILFEKLIKREYEERVALEKQQRLIEEEEAKQRLEQQRKEIRQRKRELKKQKQKLRKQKLQEEERERKRREEEERKKREQEELLKKKQEEKRKREELQRRQKQQSTQAQQQSQKKKKAKKQPPNDPTKEKEQKKEEKIDKDTKQEGNEDEKPVPKQEQLVFPLLDDTFVLPMTTVSTKKKKKKKVKSKKSQPETYIPGETPIEKQNKVNFKSSSASSVRITASSRQSSPDIVSSSTSTAMSPDSTTVNVNVGNARNANNGSTDNYSTSIKEFQQQYQQQQQKLQQNNNNNDTVVSAENNTRSFVPPSFSYVPTASAPFFMNGNANATHPAVHLLRQKGNTLSPNPLFQTSHNQLQYPPQIPCNAPLVGVAASPSIATAKFIPNFMSPIIYSNMQFQSPGPSYLDSNRIPINSMRPPIGPITSGSNIIPTSLPSSIPVTSVPKPSSTLQQVQSHISLQQQKRLSQPSVQTMNRFAPQGVPLLYSVSPQPINQMVQTGAFLTNSTHPLSNFTSQRTFTPNNSRLQSGVSTATATSTSTPTVPSFVRDNRSEDTHSSNVCTSAPQANKNSVVTPNFTSSAVVTVCNTELRNGTSSSNATTTATTETTTKEDEDQLLKEIPSSLIDDEIERRNSPPHDTYEPASQWTPATLSLSSPIKKFNEFVKDDPILKSRPTKGVNPFSKLQNLEMSTRAQIAFEVVRRTFLEQDVTNKRSLPIPFSEWWRQMVEIDPGLDVTLLNSAGDFKIFMKEMDNRLFISCGYLNNNGSNTYKRSEEPYVLEVKDVEMECFICNENTSDVLLIPCYHSLCQKCFSKMSLQPIGVPLRDKKELELQCVFCKKLVLQTKNIGKKFNNNNSSCNSSLALSSSATVVTTTTTTTTPATLPTQPIATSLQPTPSTSNTISDSRDSNNATTASRNDNIGTTALRSVPNVSSAYCNNNSLPVDLVGWSPLSLRASPPSLSSSPLSTTALPPLLQSSIPASHGVGQYNFWGSGTTTAPNSSRSDKNSDNVTAQIRLGSPFYNSSSQ